MEAPPAPAIDARLCSSAEIAALTAIDPAPIVLSCRAVLAPQQAVTRRIVFEGAEASGAGLDCNGALVGRPGLASSVQAPTVLIQSRHTPTGWSRPSDVTLRGCVVHGNIRVRGMGAGGDLEPLRASSRTPAHTSNAQAAAPTRVRLTNLTLIATGSIPLYVGPGVTDLVFEDSRVTGRSVSTAVYLDAESAGAVIRRVAFDIRTGREQIAVDGSARNRIEQNRFALGGRGGVFLYRNCGEDAVIRHQTPSDNVIAGNTFTGARWVWPNTVVVGSREGRRRYCGADRGWPFGSSVDDLDRADRNVVGANVVRRGWRLF
ncbi:hypothetical protein BZG35_16100 [Brevundimonas sp. LM2]|uniref:right-handed parallel beta-helix repeat-containing protein n=1 Tax=Brevundimonas sp. LM2 TaxID=1938605 RepID=UPI000983FEFD|nr:right-handed parallel beta-helix repeat-containing protein [Brevundimonas sp. LM2]AQR63010.1 hypothetical protein BZG35_16100 [Brevundimonas sp. LM2]